MCGIVGSTSKKIFRTDLNEMSSRGPDSRGIFSDDLVTLGHTRLSIIDVSDNSSQPLESDGSVLVFNGEIYNYKELSRDYLYGLDESDTNVLFYLLQSKGVEKTVNLLNGMFSFCYYDKLEKKIWLVRDRIGKKPLFYIAEDGLSFSSDIGLLKQIHRGETFKIDEGILSFYFSAFYVPSPRTIYSRIKSLKPGTIASFDLTTKEFKTTRYWEPFVTQRSTRSFEEFEDIFRDSVRLRQRSDVPLGAFLSGGIDSTIVVKSMAESGHVKTYTACIQDMLNEEKYAKTVADRYSTSHKTKTIEKKELLARDIRRLSRIFGQPFADSSIVPTEQICDVISRDVTVAISGDGADEFFMGYDKYKFSTSKTFEDRVFRNRDLSFIKKNLLSDPVDIVREVIPSFDHLEEIDKTNQFDIRIFLEGDILQKIDRLSMSKSLEVRSPFLDHRITQFALSTDVNQLYNSTTNEGKFELKKIVERDFGGDFAFRKKTGFMLSIDEWRQQILTLLVPLRHVFDSIDIFDKEASFGSMNSYTLFAMLVFLTWFEEMY